MADSVGTYHTVLTKAVEIIDAQAKRICFLNSQINLTNYRIDTREQYNRKESLKVYNLDPAIHGSDAVKIIMEIAKEI